MSETDNLLLNFINNFNNNNFKISENIDLQKISFTFDNIHPSQINTEFDNLELIKNVRSEFPEIPVEEILYFKKNEVVENSEYIEDKFLRITLLFGYKDFPLKNSKAWVKILKLYKDLNYYDNILYKQTFPNEDVYSYYPYFEENEEEKTIEMEIFIFFRNESEKLYEIITNFFTETL